MAMRRMYSKLQGRVQSKGVDDQKTTEYWSYDLKACSGHEGTKQNIGEDWVGPGRKSEKVVTYFMSWPPLKVVDRVLLRKTSAGYNAVK